MFQVTIYSLYESRDLRQRIRLFSLLKLSCQQTTVTSLASGPPNSSHRSKHNILSNVFIHTKQ